MRDISGTRIEALFSAKRKRIYSTRIYIIWGFCQAALDGDNRFLDYKEVADIFLRDKNIQITSQEKSRLLKVKLMGIKIVDHIIKTIDANVANGYIIYAQSIRNKKR